MKIKLSITMLLLAALSGCNLNSIPVDFDYGHVENNKYINSFFGFKMNVLPDWSVQSKEQTEDLAKKARELYSDDSNKKAIIKASEVNTAYLLTVFKYERGSPVDFNPSIMLLVENVKNTPGIKNGSDYLFHARKLLTQSAVKYDFIDSVFKKVMIGKQEFYKMNATLNAGDFVVQQDYYSSITKGFSFDVIISYKDVAQKVELKKMIESMEFEE